MFRAAWLSPYLSPALNILALKHLSESRRFPFRRGLLRVSLLKSVFRLDRRLRFLVQIYSLFGNNQNVINHPNLEISAIFQAFALAIFPTFQVVVNVVEITGG